MKKIVKFIGNRDFYKMVLMIAVPIMIQNGITNFVSLLDNIMIGQVGTEQMSGVAIVNQLIFVYNLCIFGGVSGHSKSSEFHSFCIANFFYLSIIKDSAVCRLQTGKRNFCGKRKGKINNERAKKH